MTIHTIPYPFGKSELVRLLFKPHQNKLIIVELLFLITGALMILREIDSPTQVGFIGYAFIGWAVLYPFLVWFRFYRFVSNPMNRIMLEPMTFHLTDESIHAQWQDGTSSVMPWHRVVKVQCYDDTFLLYLNQTSIFIVAPHVFKSPAEFDEFRRFLDAKGLYSYDRKK